MKIDLVFPKLPPALDGIGDHTARLAAALAASGEHVRVLAAQPEADPIPGVEVARAFSMEQRRGIWELASAVEADPPDWLVLQFNQFSYGRWGLNPHVPLVLRHIKKKCPGLRLAVLFHEDFVPVTSWKFALMTLWQRWQFWMLGRQADLIFFTIEEWARQYQPWFPDAPVRSLPVGSNIPHVGVSRSEARRRIGLAEETFVLGLFGSARGSRLMPYIRRAAEAIRQRTPDVAVLYVGLHSAVVQEALNGLPLVDAGPLPAEEVSVHLSAMDVHLTPFGGGVSSRRGSFMAGLQHGVATVSTEGALTDAALRWAAGEAFLLAPAEDEAAFVRQVAALYEDPGRRAHVAAAGRAFYEASFSWDAVSERLLAALRETASSNLHPVR